MNRPTVLVTDATRNPGLALIRELGQVGFDVRGADSRRLPLGLHSRYSPPYLDYGGAADDELAETLLAAVRLTRPEACLPVSTPITRIVSKHRSEFASLTGVNVPDFGSFLTAMDNERTLSACAEVGIPCPRTLELSEAADLLGRSPGATPAASIVIKPKLDLGAAQGVRYVSSPEALEAGLAANADLYGESVLQEYIPGSTDSMRVVVLLFDRDSELIAQFTARKILQWPESGGMTALAISTHEPELVALDLPFFHRLRWQGVAEAELKVDPRDGIPKLIEVNPRLPSYTGFPTRCGVPLATLLAKAALGERIEPRCPPYSSGTHVIRTSDFLRVMWSQLRRPGSRTEALGRLWSELGARARPPSLDWSDPLPRIGKLLWETTSTSRDKRERSRVDPG